MPRPDSTELLARLVSFDTTSSRTNLPLIDFVRDYLTEFGVESRTIPDATGEKANLYALVGGDPARPALVLSGHTDVVPVDASAWKSDPFAVREQDGRLFGRGTADMKGFIACSLAAVPDILAAKLPFPVGLAFSYDEEVGCLGVPGLIRSLAENPPRPFLCIVGEPTSMQPVLAHKGKIALRCHVYGLEAHSAMTHIGANAIEAAAEIIGHIASVADRIRSEGPHVDGFTPPYTTLQTSRIAGGTATNIVPDYCRFDFEIRNTPGDDADAILARIKSFAEARIVPKLRARHAGARVEWEKVFAYPAFNIDASDKAARWIVNLTGSNSTGKVSYGTEAGLFHDAGIPTVVCGPGSIEQAHKRDEFIAADQLAACDAFLRRMIAEFARRG